MPDVDPDADPAALVDDLHEQLRATEELPVERSAGRWIGEAQAVAADLAGADASDDVVRDRVEHVRTLLREVDGTGHPEADERVDAAREIADAILDRAAAD